MRTRAIAEAALCLALVTGATAALSGCGRVGPMERPAPMFGERAKEEYRADQAADAARARRASAASANAVADQPDPTDNAPVTKRDLQAPEQKLTPLSQSPLPGSIDDPRGAPPSLTPPN